MPGCGLLVNTTPLGMAGMAHDFTDLRFLDALPRDACVCDLIYDPPKTALLARAEATGHPTLNGLSMLVWQAFYAFEQYTGVLPGREEYKLVTAGIPDAAV
jgi:shikimate dehydrogenase